MSFTGLVGHISKKSSNTTLSKSPGGGSEKNQPLGLEKKQVVGSEKNWLNSKMRYSIILFASEQLIMGF